MQKKLINKLVEECDKVNDRNEMTYNSVLNYYEIL